jgi:hypothetical protein
MQLSDIFTPILEVWITEDFKNEKTIVVFDFHKT